MNLIAAKEAEQTSTIETTSDSRALLRLDFLHRALEQPETDLSPCLENHKLKVMIANHVMSIRTLILCLLGLVLLVPVLLTPPTPILADDSTEDPVDQLLSEEAAYVVAARARYYDIHQALIPLRTALASPDNLVPPPIGVGCLPGCFLDVQA